MKIINCRCEGLFGNVGLREVRSVAWLVHEARRVDGLVSGHYGLGHGHYGLGHGLDRVYVDAVLGHYGVEAVVMICRVVHCAYRAVSLHQGVLPAHSVSIPVLPLALDVTRVQVVHAVVEQVVRVSLQQQINTC